ncbi:MAG TPA: hypothetical protein O0X70_03735 [Methanocorpusculum sp.]|nr:hypothetical protein [Methanocorpusculum sp.]
MVLYTPKYLQVLIFDLEAYVPKADRRRRYGTSLTVNPYKPEHTLLGGVFSLKNPATGEVYADFAHHWTWREGGEEEVVQSIYALFAGIRARIRDKPAHAADPVICGIGIGTFDMPFLYTKFLQYQVAPPEEIYEVFCKNRVVDLSVAGIGFLQKQAPLLHPRAHNELADRFVPDRDRKPTGKVVWEMYDDREFAAIESRCEGEVREMAKIYEALLGESISE